MRETTAGMKAPGQPKTTSQPDHGRFDCATGILQCFAVSGHPIGVSTLWKRDTAWKRDWCALPGRFHHGIVPAAALHMAEAALVTCARKSV